MNKGKNKRLKIIGVNAAGLMSKIDSFEKLLSDEQPSIFCIQETKNKRANKLKTDSTKMFTIYELNRKEKSGGGLCIGVLNDLHPAWVGQGDDEVECLAVEVWVEDFPIRVVTAYGPQLGDPLIKKQKFLDFIENQAINAYDNGAGFILQMDSNSHLGPEVIKNDPNLQNLNGRLFCEFLDRMPHLTIINSLPLCDGLITRMRKTSKGTEKSVLDVFVTCNRILPFITKMTIDENRELALTNFNGLKNVGRVIESDHNVEILELNLQFSNMKPSREEFFDFKNRNSQVLFKDLTTNTTVFSECFKNDLKFEEQASKWKKLLDEYFHKAFRKVRISNKNKTKSSNIQELIQKRKNLKKQNVPEETIEEIEDKIAEFCQEANRNKVMENFNEVDGADGNIAHHGIWNVKRKIFPKIKPPLPVGKKNLKGQLITNHEELKDLYLDTFKHRLRHRPILPGYEENLEKQEELFRYRLDISKRKKTPPWGMKNLDIVLQKLKNGKCRDPDGIIREIFKHEVIGEDLKQSLLIMLNKIKDTGTIPEFMKVVNIHAIYKGKGELTELDSERGIFIVSILRTILMKMIYEEKYQIIDKSMSDSNIGARKKKNIRNHIFIVNSIIHDVLSSKNKEPIDIMVLDYKQMFDSECLYECLNDVFEAGVDDDYFPLLYEANKETFVAVHTPGGMTRREMVPEIVMQGDVMAPLISSLQVDTMGKECLDMKKHLFMYKDMVPIPPLGLVDDLLTISTCGVKTSLMNRYINTKSALKKLQFGTTKCVKLHAGKRRSDVICREQKVDSWKVKVVTDPVTGLTDQTEEYAGQEVMENKDSQLYLGDVIASDGRCDLNIQRRKNKSIGIINQIMVIMNSTFFGKYYFEVAMVLRTSLLLNSILLNSEAWVNLTNKNIRMLEQIDESFLSKILECEANTSNTIKYLELGIYPIRFEIMKRKIIFLQYILKQEKSSMMYQVLKATWENPIKNDFVKICTQYLSALEIKMSFEEIEIMSEKSFKKLVKAKTEKAAFKYLQDEKQKQTKIINLHYHKLEIQEYFINGNCNKRVAKTIFKARSKTLDIKVQKRWKYADLICVGCKLLEESGDEIMLCEVLNNQNKISEFPVTYDWFFSQNIQDVVKAGKVVSDGLKRRQEILETGIT